MDVMREEISQGVFGHLAPEPPREKEGESQQIIKTHIHIGDKSLELSRRVRDLEQSTQEHFKFHSTLKKGSKPKTYDKIKQ
jgi:hypothetical protein